jgi:hypothetical protein
VRTCKTSLQPHKIREFRKILVVLEQRQKLRFAQGHGTSSVLFSAFSTPPYRAEKTRLLSRWIRHELPQVRNGCQESPGITTENCSDAINTGCAKQTWLAIHQITLQTFGQRALVVGRPRVACKLVLKSGAKACEQTRNNLLVNGPQSMFPALRTCEHHHLASEKLLNHVRIDADYHRLASEQRLDISRHMISVLTVDTSVVLDISIVHKWNAESPGLGPSRQVESPWGRAKLTETNT